MFPRILTVLHRDRNGGALESPLRAVSRRGNTLSFVSRAKPKATTESLYRGGQPERAVASDFVDLRV